MAGHAAPHAAGGVKQQVEHVKQASKASKATSKSSSRGPRQHARACLLYVLYLLLYSLARGSTRARLLYFDLLTKERVKQGPAVGRELLAAEREAFRTRSTDLPFLLKKKIGRM